MTAEISEQDRLADPVDTHLVGRLRAALAVLSEPWVVLAGRRASGADGPPWVRYIVLHPDKGIALVDTDDPAPAVAPLDDFLWHTGFAALQGDALCIVAVTITADTLGTVADQIAAAFGGSPCGLANPNWCEAVVDLLLATPDLMLTRLRPAASVAAVTSPVASHGDRVHASQAESPATIALSAPARERWPAKSKLARRQPTWRSWPVSPVAAAMALLALGTVVLVAHQASPPANEIAHARPAAVVASAASPTPPAPSAATARLPGAAAALPPPAAPPSAPSVDVASASAPPVRAATVAPPKKVTPHATTEHAARRPVTPPMPAVPPRQVASANTTRAVCADVLHPELPGGWQYRGPPVPGCLPIRFFGLIGMR
ncbi:MAG TPA: hypothetical protein VJS41_01565 [Stellaceae bacterium]|nr:hypothetical protein [Stellaceae bacterium]